MRFAVSAVAIIIATAIGLTINNEIKAQTSPARLAIRNGESVELHLIYYVSHCRSIMVGLPEVEILEGPAELSLSIREEAVLPRRLGCAAKVAGGTLLLTAKDVSDKIHANLIYRLKYLAKDGPRETSSTYFVSLFP
jgi:hypothetical protein